jgi:hypothetical protein
MLSYKVEYTSPLMTGPKEVTVGSSEAIASPVPSNAAGPSGKDGDKRQNASGTAPTGGAGESKGSKLGVSFEIKGPGK